MNRMEDTSLTFKAGIISLSRFLYSFSSLIIFVILSRYLSKTDYGSYRQVWLIYNTLVPLFVIGLPTSINYFIPQLKKQEQKAFNIQTFLVLISSGFVLSIILFAGSPLIAHWLKNQDLIKIIRIFSLVPFLTFPTLYYQNLFICLDKARQAAGLSILMTILRLIAVAIPVTLHRSLDVIFVSLVIFSVLQLAVVAFFVLKPYFGVEITPQGFRLIRQFKYAVPLGLATLVGVLTLQIDKLFIASIFSVSQYAIYVNGAQGVPLIPVITGSVAVVLMPEFVKMYKNNDSHGVLNTWHMSIKKISLIVFPIMFFLLVFAPEFLVILFSPKYVDSAGIFRIYLLILPSRITSFGTILLAMGFSGLVFRYTAYTLLINIGLNFLLVYTIGFSGPAVATVIAIYLINSLQLRRISIEMNVRINHIFPWKTIMRFAAIAGGAGGAVFLFKYLTPPEWGIWKIGIGAVVYCVLFFATGLALKWISKEDLMTPFFFLKALKS